MSIGTKEPSNTSAIPSREPELTPPDEKSDYIDLGFYIKQHLQVGDRLVGEVAAIERKTTVHRWYAGAALKIVQDRETKGRKWVVWCQNHGFNLGTCYEAIRLFQRSGGVENVEDLTITEARKKYQTSKRSFLPPGQAPPPRKVATKPASTRKYTETATLSKLRLEMETIGDTMGGATTEDWNNADPDKFIGHINKLIEMLSSTKKAIREAQKAAKTPAKPRSKPKPTIRASVGEAEPARMDDHETPHEMPAVPKTARSRRA